MIKKIYSYSIIFLIFFLSSCEGLVVEESIGCLSGIFPGTNNRTYIFCVSKSEYASLGNTFNGTTYDNVIWTEINNCNECLTLDYSNL